MNHSQANFGSASAVIKLLALSRSGRGAKTLAGYLPQEARNFASIAVHEASHAIAAEAHGESWEIRLSQVSHGSFSGVCSHRCSEQGRAVLAKRQIALAGGVGELLSEHGVNLPDALLVASINVRMSALDRHNAIGFQPSDVAGTARALRDRWAAVHYVADLLHRNCGPAWGLR